MAALLKRRKRTELEAYLNSAPDNVPAAKPPPTTSTQITSILAVDMGNVHTRAVLIDQVEGVYRLVGRSQTRTTAGFPIGDAYVGVERALLAMSQSTGRMLTREDGRVIIPEQSDRSGVDLFVATASLGRRLRTVMMGLVPDVSVISAQRAAAGTYIDIVETISLDDRRSAQDQMNAMILARPDLIFIAGGTEGGAEAPVLELAQTARLASRLMPRGHRPIILYAGNSALIERIEALFSDQTLLIADNVRPTLDVEALESAQAQLAAAFDSFAEAQIVGFDRVGALSRIGVQPTAQSIGLIAEYLGRTAGDTLILDIGSGSSALATYVYRHLSTSIRTDIGLGQSAGTLLRAVGIDAVRAWLPLIASDNEIAAYAYNKTLRPMIIPDRQRTLYFEHALLRAGAWELLRAARPAWTTDTAYDDPNAPMPPFAQIIACGAALTNTGQPGMTAMLILDALQPVGVTRLRSDPGGLVAALGAVARVTPEAVVQILDGESLDDLGTCLNVSGTPREGAPAVRVRVTNADGVSETHTVMGGTLFIVPLPSGLRADVRVRVLRRGLHIGGKRQLRLRVMGGAAGIIIDARGRPLPLAANPRGVAAQLPAWYAQATGEAVRRIPEDWLTPKAPVVTEYPLAAAEMPAEPGEPKRRTLAEAARSGRGRGKKAEEAPKLAALTSEKPERGRKRRGQPQQQAQIADDDLFPDLSDDLPSGKSQKKDDLDDLRTLFP
jgi:hypothetical protein